ncbi:DMT family transporter [Spongorhabdus nitratireducens]
MLATENVPKGVAYAVATTLFASTAAAATKLIASDVPIPVIVLAQYLICFVIMLPWLGRYSFRSLKTERFGVHLVRGVSGWLCFYAYYTALSQIPLVDAALLRNSGPLFVPLVVWLWMKFKVPGKAWLPMLLGFVGVIMVLQPDMADIKIWHLVGLTSGLTLAISMVATRALSRTEPSGRIMFYYFVLSVICSLPLALLNWKPLPLWCLPWLFYIGFAICLTMWCYTRAYTCAPASVVSPLNYTGIVFSGLLGWIVWDHLPDTLALSGMLLVVVAGLLAVFLNSSGAKAVTSNSNKDKAVVGEEQGAA